MKPVSQTSRDRKWPSGPPQAHTAHQWWLHHHCKLFCSHNTLTNLSFFSFEWYRYSVCRRDRLCGLAVRVPGYRADVYCASCEVRTEFIYVMKKKVDRHCGLAVRVPRYRADVYCDSCEVRTEFIYVKKKKVDRLCDLVVRVPGYRSRGPGSIPGATWFSEKQWVWNGVHSASWVQLRSGLKEKAAASV
jgi:hypothetical protein